MKPQNVYQEGKRTDLYVCKGDQLSTKVVRYQLWYSKSNTKDCCFQKNFEWTPQYSLRMCSAQSEFNVGMLVSRGVAGERSSTVYKPAVRAQ